MSSPFRTVTAAQSIDSHLVVASPALVGCRPDELAPTTLCGRPTIEEIATPPAEVKCERCLLRAPAFMHLPSYREQVTR